MSHSIGLAAQRGDAQTDRVADPEALPLTRRQLRERERAGAIAAQSTGSEPQTRRQRRAREAAERPTAAEPAEIVATTTAMAVPASAAVAVPVAALAAPDVVAAPATVVPDAGVASASAVALIPAVPQVPVMVERGIRGRSPNESRPLLERPQIASARNAVRRTHRKRKWASISGMLAAAGLLVTFALPAYAYTTSTSSDGFRAESAGATQQLSVSNVNMPVTKRDGYTTIANVAAWDSTLGTTVSPTVQALAANLMSAVAAGRLAGSNPDHIPEIRNLANGVAVPGCGVDYRVLQVIQVALDNFNTVRVSDINRRCTGQIEGAGLASAHYADGGGHAVDFDMLNGQALTGGDANSMRLIHILDPIVPPATNLGQAECRASTPLQNFVAFDDSCTHLHIDFGTALGTALRE